MQCKVVEKECIKGSFDESSLAFSCVVVEDVSDNREVDSFQELIVLLVSMAVKNSQEGFHELLQVLFAQRVYDITELSFHKSFCNRFELEDAFLSRQVLLKGVELLKSLPVV